MNKKNLILTAFLALCMTGCKQVQAPEAIGPVPTNNQVEWQQREKIAFIHFGLNTFEDQEWGYGDADPKIFNPTRLDCEQWVQTLLNAGIKEVVITTKHHDGFCLWPTQQTEYCIRNSPYKDGKGDVVGELADACQRHGMKFGIYLSPWDRNHAQYGQPEYVDYYMRELHEVLGNYGEISEVWLDGANGGDGYYGGAREKRNIDKRNYYNFPAIHALVAEMQPKAVIFSDAGPGCRWVGNENGEAGQTNWSFLRSKDVYPGYPNMEELTVGHADGDIWVAAECDVSIRPGWFYHAKEDSLVKTPEQLLDLYYKSVGRNGVLMLNFPVNKEGLISSQDSLNAVEAHKLLQKELKTNLLAGLLAEVTDTRGGHFDAWSLTDGKYETYWATNDDVTAADVTFMLQSNTKIDRLMLQEYIPLGQRVKSFKVEYLKGGAWKELDPHEETTTIGYKRILRFDPVEVSGLRIRFTDARACLCINNIAAYYSGN